MVKAGRGRPGTGVSIADVARRAGVSGQTVSRVSMGINNVRPETRGRVLAAMEELGYAPNSAARALRYGSYRTLGVIAHRLGRTGESLTVEAVVEAARARGYTVTLVDVQSPTSVDVSAAAHRLSHQAIDGLVIIRAELGSGADLLLPPRLPVVVSDSRFVDQHPAVGSDQVAGVRLAVEHLLGLGHTTVHHLAGPTDSAPAMVRREAWERVLRDAGRPVPAVLDGDWTAASGYAAGAAVRAAMADGGLTAVFCANDEMAAGLARHLHEQGIDVPGDVSLVGFDDMPLAGYLWPPLTTIAQRFGEIGVSLVDLLLEQSGAAEGDDDAVAAPREPHRVSVPVDLVVRASTAPPADD